MKNKQLRLGTRGRRLANWQSNWIKTELETLGHAVIIVVIKTDGDLKKLAHWRTLTDRVSSPNVSKHSDTIKWELPSSHRTRTICESAFGLSLASFRRFHLAIKAPRPLHVRATRTRISKVEGILMFVQDD